MDRITKTLVEDFLNSLELKPGDLSNDFEKFVNYTIISKEYTKTFDVDTIQGYFILDRGVGKPVS